MEDSFLYAQMCKWVLFSERQTDLKDGAVFGTFGNLYGSAVQGSDFMHKGETESDAAERAAAGFVYAEEWLKDTFTKFLTDAGTGVGNCDDGIFSTLCGSDGYAAVFAVIAHGIFGQVKYDLID